ncbi:hypothetical protein F4604DRAFT_1953144 [Suillus subluteus]|nr:hypothetical protein F4604DRAFT_1953144 [Suillus subluteus]
MPGMYEDYFPIVWKVATFAAEGVYSLTVNYKHQFALIKPQVQNGRIVDATTAVEINVGQTTTLTKAGHVFHFSTPEAGLPGALKAINDTGERQEIAVGTTNLEMPVILPHKFTPKLRAYITPAYQEDDILRAAIHTPPIWERDLTALNQSTTWNITWDPSGRYAIAEA